MRLTTRTEIENGWRAMQITEPTSAYDILSRVCDLITEEPRRLRMSDWGMALTPDRIEGMGINSATVPHCGTVACVAGWAGILMFGNLNQLGREISEILTGSTNHLYCDVFINEELTCDCNQGLPEHAAKVVGAIHNFQYANEALLRGRIIDPKNPFEVIKAVEAVEATE